MTERKKLVLVDGNSLAYRAFFALPLLSNEKGIHTNAVYGFTTILMKMLEEEKPTHMLVAFDAGKTTFRHKTFKEYKGGRQKTPPELSEQLPFIRELLAYGTINSKMADVNTLISGLGEPFGGFIFLGLMCGLYRWIRSAVKRENNETRSETDVSGK